MTRERIIIDTDPGVDDAMAILFALNSPEVDVEGLTVVHGNTEVEYCCKNALRILEVAGRSDIPVAKGIGRPLIREPRWGKQIHGTNGLGDVELGEPNVSAIEEHAVDFIIRKVMQNPKDITLVAIGPLTNVAVALLKEPRVANSVKQIVFMGGAITVPGNASPVASANLYHDPESARIVFSSGAPIVMAGLDVARKLVFTESYINEFREGKTPAAQFIAKVSTTCYLECYSKRLGQVAYQSNDTPTLGYLIAPELYRTRRLFVDIETRGELTSGETVADLLNQFGREPNVDVCLELEAEKLREVFMDRVAR
ncbi:MAG: nucleoside hydrolase [Bacillota bacterium]